MLDCIDSVPCINMSAQNCGQYDAPALYFLSRICNIARKRRNTVRRLRILFVNSKLHFTGRRKFLRAYTITYDSHVRFEFEKESNNAATDPARGDSCNVHLVTIAPKMILLFLAVGFTENILKI